MNISVNKHNLLILNINVDFLKTPFCLWENTYFLTLSCTLMPPPPDLKSPYFPLKNVFLWAEGYEVEPYYSEIVFLNSQGGGIKYTKTLKKVEGGLEVTKVEKKKLFVVTYSISSKKIIKKLHVLVFWEEF